MLLPKRKKVITSVVPHEMVSQINSIRICLDNFCMWRGCQRALQLTSVLPQLPIHTQYTSIFTLDAKKSGNSVHVGSIDATHMPRSSKGIGGTSGSALRRVLDGACGERFRALRSGGFRSIKLQFITKVH